MGPEQRCSPYDRSRDYGYSQSMEARIVESMYDFPHQAGLDKARSFKKAATFVCLFVGERPFVNSVSVALRARPWRYN